MTDSQVQYQGYNANRLHSPSIWADCPKTQILTQMNDGFYEFDDFLNYKTTASGVINAHGVPVFEGSAAIRGTAGTTQATSNGILEIMQSASNEEAGFERGGGVSAPYLINNAAGEARKLWFECRVKDQLVDNVGNWFVGLCAPGTMIADFISDLGTDYSNTSFIGFTRHEDDGDSIDFTYRSGALAVQTLIAGVAVPVADTFLKLGFSYDPNAPSSKRIKVYVNGAVQTTFVTKTLIDTSTFPEGEAMGMGAAVKGSAGDDRSFSIDWWSGGQA